MSRETLLIAVRAVKPDTHLGGEIAHQMSVEDREYAYDEVSALFDAYAQAEANRYDAVIGKARDLLIEHGFYRVMPQHEQDETIRTGGRQVYDFRRRGDAYTTDFNVEEWQWPDSIW